MVGHLGGQTCTMVYVYVLPHGTRCTTNGRTIPMVPKWYTHQRKWYSTRFGTTSSLVPFVARIDQMEYTARARDYTYAIVASQLLIMPHHDGTVASQLARTLVATYMTCMPQYHWNGHTMVPWYVRTSTCILVSRRYVTKLIINN